MIFHDSRTLKSKLNLSQSLKFQAELGTIVLRYFRQRLSRSFCLHWMHFPNDEWWGNMDWRIQCFAYLCESTAKNLKSSLLANQEQKCISTSILKNKKKTFKSDPSSCPNYFLWILKYSTVFSALEIKRSMTWNCGQKWLPLKWVWREKVSDPIISWHTFPMFKGQEKYTGS